MTRTAARTHAPAPSRSARLPQQGIPRTREEREKALLAVRDYVARHGLTAPLTLEQLHQSATALLERLGADGACRNWIMVLLNNETWRKPLATIPFNRRLLLLPQCLRDQEHCQGVMDEVGLLCRGCGRCVLHKFTREAEALGYVTLISEGLPAVLALVQSGQISGFVGSSCMTSLVKIFPVMSVVGLPAIAIPLLYDGCAATQLDVEWLLEAIRLRDGRPAEGKRRR